MDSSLSVILIIDADPITRTGVAAVLTMQGHECHCASNSAAAMKAALALPMDVIICDVEIDGESGIDLCTRIRAAASVEDAPVIFVSNLQVADVVCRAHEASSAYFLLKPFDPDTLIQMVETALWMPHLVHNRIQHDVQTGETQRAKIMPTARRPLSRDRRRETVR
jgi:DNA-binding response OmpR family regulator